ncbi:hypothetical protein CDD83_1601 [Cordyceps sp. RAO-2017]|nr:hypothetical protein CDD83_1601 [Cordyceps sp. RAO-2017]
MYNTYFNRVDKDRIETQYGSVNGKASPQKFQLAAVGPALRWRPQPVHWAVDDKNVFALAGVGGHAGLFSTVADTAALF